MKIVCSSSMPFAREAFGTIGDVTIVPGSVISAGDVRDAEILAVRSTTKVDHSLLHNSAVKFVGTATIGFNHMDTEYLDNNGIAWCSAPGCNSNSVSEYVVAALLNLAVKHGVELENQMLGIIGVGNVGSLVAKKAACIGMKVLKNDPPKAREAVAKKLVHDYVSKDIVLKECRIVTLHVPLTNTGADSTFHLADVQFFAGMRSGSVLVNCSRGAVVDTGALMKSIARKRTRRTVIDTWESEPDISWELLEKTDLATPHIAGYSFEGKVIGTKMVYDRACEFLGINPAWDYEPYMPPSNVPEITCDAAGKSDVQALNEIVSGVYDITRDDAALRSLFAEDAGARPKLFEGLRNNYPVRREFSATQVSLLNASNGLRTKVRGLGFKLMA